MAPLTTEQAWMTVEWSRPPNWAPIDFREAWVKSRAKNIPTCLAQANSEVLRLESNSLGEI